METTGSRPPGSWDSCPIQAAPLCSGNVRRHISTQVSLTNLIQKLFQAGILGVAYLPVVLFSGLPSGLQNGSWALAICRRHSQTFWRPTAMQPRFEV